MGSLLIPKLTLVGIMMIIWYINLNIANLGLGEALFKKGSLRALYQQWNNIILIRTALNICANFTIRYNKVDVDYSQYLGPDWEKKYNGASTLVSNHSHYFDIILKLAYLEPASFIAKRGVKDYFFVGELATRMKTMFIQRGGTKEERLKVLEEIMKRQEENEKGVSQPLVIYPEGTATNNSSLIQFRRGAFYGLHSI